MKRTGRCIGLLLLFLSNMPVASAQSYAEPGPGLNMLQHIQGRWRSPCRPVDDGPDFGYEQINLSVNFTHFTVVTEVFENSRCLVKKASHTLRYRFILREPIQTPSGEDVFGIDFRPEDADVMGHHLLHPLNIVSYKSGTLRLGEPPVVESAERLQKLDRELIFSR